MAMWVNLSGFFSKLTVASGFTLELEEAVLNLLTYANEMENKEVLTFFRLQISQFSVLPQVAKVVGTGALLVLKTCSPFSALLHSELAEEFAANRELVHSFSIGLGFVTDDAASTSTSSTSSSAPRGVTIVQF